jgi:aflatoxin B1 aldehyde reductase
MPLVASSPRDRIILGLMTFGPKSEDGARITDLDTFKSALDVFQKRGYNEVDTARTYVGNQQEAFTSQAGWKERGLTLATKVHYPGKDGDNEPDKILASVETSLKDLGTDCVDVRDTSLARDVRRIPS